MFRVFWSESGSDSCARGLEPPKKVTQERDVAGEDRKGEYPRGSEREVFLGMALVRARNIFSGRNGFR